MRVSTPRRPFAFAALASLLVLSLSCGGDSGDPSPTPTEVTVTPGADTLLSVGETQAFVAVVLDANGDPIDDAEIAWSSTVPGVVSVDPVTGVATAVTNGSAQVRATSGTLEGTAPVTVAQVPTTITILPSALTLTFVNDTQRFTATVLDAGGTPVAPLQMVWTLNDNTVATIDSGGLVRAKGPGIALVTMVAIGPGGAKAGYASVSTTQTPMVLAFRVQPVGWNAGEVNLHAIQVEVRDSGGSVASAASVPITLAVDSGPLDAALYGTLVVHSVNGVATFSGITTRKAGLLRLKATAAGLGQATSSLALVLPAAADSVAFTAVPDSTVAGEPLGAVAALYDRFGNLATTHVGSLRFQLLTDSVGVTLFGVDSAAVSNGSATLSATVTRAGQHDGLRVWATGTDSAVTATFIEVVPSSPVAVAVLGEPQLAVDTASSGNGVIVLQVVDSFGNRTRALGGLEFPPPVIEEWEFGVGQEVFADSGHYFVQGAMYEFSSVAVRRPGRTALRFEMPGLPTLILDSLFGLAPTTDGPFGAGILAGGDVTCLQPARYCVGSDGLLTLGGRSAGGLDSVLYVVGPPFSYGGDAGGDHICKLFKPSNVGTMLTACWGNNADGQLGNGSAGAPVGTPVLVTGGHTFVQVTAGTSHTCGLTAAGEAWCWGNNGSGQLGNAGAGAGSATPVLVDGGHDFRFLAAGGAHTCGLLDSTQSRVYCWGEGSSGQLGDSASVDRASPVPAAWPRDWSGLVAGADFTCATSGPGQGWAVTDTTRNVYCWGANDAGQLGNDSLGVSRNVPRRAKGLLAYTRTPNSIVAGDHHVCVVPAFGEFVVCWGKNDRGQVGTGSIGAPVPAPSLVSSYFIGSGGPVGGGVGALLSPSYFAAGRSHTCLGSQVRCWGANDKGQLGDGTTVDRATPTLMIQ